jgi:hypothetical protein
MKEFIKQDDKIYVNVPYAEAYIAEELFKTDEETASSIAVQYADGYKTVGIFNMRFYQSDEDDRESSPIRTFNYPNMIMTYPSDSIANVKLHLTNGDDSDDKDATKYRVLRYYLGDIIMAAEEVQDAANCTKFLNMITKGKIPNTIPYDVFVEIWHNNFQINDFNPQVPSVTLQMIWAEMCRCPDDITKPFRLLYGKGGANTTNYVETNMNNVASATSVFSALSFERFSDKMTTSLNMTREGVQQRRSPVEEVLSM